MEHFLHFTKGERIGLFVLMLICVGLFIAPRFLVSNDTTTDFTSLEKDIQHWYAASDVAVEVEKSETTTSITASSFNPNYVTNQQLQAHGLPKKTIRAWLSYIKKGGHFNSIDELASFRALSSTDLEKISSFLIFPTKETSTEKSVSATAPSEIVYFEFDPNSITKEELISLGVPSKTANNWTKYLASGASFYQASDISKVYGLSDSDYQRLLPYAKVQEIAADSPIASNDTPRSYNNTSRPNIVIDINQANAEQWQELRGIGPAFSKRIVNFRDKLGGFHQVNQVAETYGLPDSVFQKIQLSLRPSPIFRTLSINHLTEKELASHPYISFNDAKTIVQYRGNHGFYQQISDLEKLYALDAKTIEKITPYLVFD